MITENTVHYLCFYAEAENKDYLVTFPSAWNKIEFIISAIHKCEYRVCLVSASRSSVIGFHKSKKIVLSNYEKHHYFSSYRTKYELLNKIDIVFSWVQIIRYILLEVKRNDVILVYHSLFFIKPLWIFKKIFNKDFILQIEEYYSKGDKIAESYYKDELRVIKLAKSCICVNEKIKQKMISYGKMAICAYGDYRVPSSYNVTKNKKQITLIYAGVIESIRKAAFIAIEIMEFLNKNYRLKILGFGSSQDISKLEMGINRINKKLGYSAVVYCGHMLKKQFSSFLQECDIALSTHTYTQESINTSTYNFPSKVITYLSNNLRVVAQRIECLENSSVGPLLNFYDVPDPFLIAETIKSIDLSKPYNSSEFIEKLDKQFVEDLTVLLKS